MLFPRGGCQTCRDRRIKCDKTQPICQRCTKSQRTCYGMGEQQIWHAENAYASRQKKRPRGPRSTRRSRTATPPHVSNDLNACAIAYYRQYYLPAPQDVPDIVKDVARACLPRLPASPWCSVLDLAITSLALAVFAKTQHYPRAAIEASTKYHRLLQITQTAIHYVNPTNVDSCLLAIFFMGRYEDAVHHPHDKERSMPSFQSFSHHDGALAILKLWNDQLSHDRPATKVIQHTRRGTLRSALMRKIDLPEWIRDGAFFGETGLELEYDRILVRLVTLRHRLWTLTDEVASLPHLSSELASRVENLSKEALDLDAVLATCITRVPHTWNILRLHILSSIDLPCWPSSDFYSPTVYSYLSPAYAAFWGQYHATRLIIKNTRLRLLALSNTSDPTSKQQLLLHMQTISDDLASAIPFCLQRFKIAESVSTPSQSPIALNLTEKIKPSDATLVTWPLTIASSLEYIDVEQKKWFKGQLARIGKLVGFGVLESAESDQWLEL
ncbi:hypothetical protein BBP40_003542 [Aspergillus hancockii]|nr:hypothetical protein BBP40_003542 [Aspergillus hancockii]